MELTWQKSQKGRKTKLGQYTKRGQSCHRNQPLTTDEQTLNDVWNQRKYKTITCCYSARECLAQTACVFFPVRSSLLMKYPANYSGHHEENENMR
jgi:hypothetical protein